MSVKFNKKVAYSVLTIIFLCCFAMSKQFSKADGNLILEYSFTNNQAGNASGEIKLTSNGGSNSGTYDIYWANDTGKLSDYEKIASIKMEGGKGTYKMVSLLAIPAEANKIVAMNNNSIVAQYNIPTNKLITVNKKFSFGALSDIHLDGDGKDDINSNSDFQNELDYFKSKNVALICNSGDITSDGRKEDVDAVVNKIQSLNIPFYTARGNHDCRNACESMNEWNRIEPNGIIFEKIVNNEVFVFLGLNSDNFDKAFTSEQLSQLKNILDKYKNKRVFLFEHVFYGEVGNVNGLYPHRSLPNSGPAGEFKDLMKKYQNVISFTGHSHLDFDLQRANEFANVAVKDGEYGYRVHCPSASKPRKNDKAISKSDTYNYEEGALGYLVDVYDNYIVLTGRDFTQNKNIPYATYILYTDSNSYGEITISDVNEDNSINNEVHDNNQIIQSENNIDINHSTDNNLIDNYAIKDYSINNNTANVGSENSNQINQSVTDIVIVIDKSMSYNDRFANAKTLIKQFAIKAMESNNINMSVVEFGLNANTLIGLSNSSGDVNNALEQVNLQNGVSGSNMHAGVCNAIDQLKRGSSSNKAIIIISDGRTNRRKDDIKNHNREKSRAAVKNELEKAKSEMPNLKVAVIGYAKDDDSASKEFLNSIATTCNGQKMYYSSVEINNKLEQARSNILN